jgi:hypothetical protein
MPHDPRADRPGDAEADGVVPGHDAGPAGAGRADGDEARPEPLDDMIDDLLDGEDDPELAALLGAVGTRLSVPPDELTRRRHLTAMEREGASPSLLLRVAQRTGVAAAAAMVVGGLLAGGGWLPDPIQREVADAAAQVGIQLPRPEAPERVGHEAEEADDPAGDPADGADAPSSPGPDTAGDDGTAPGDEGHESDPTEERDAAEHDGRDGTTTPLPGQDGPRQPAPDLLEPPEMDPGEERHIVPIEPPVRPEEWDRDHEQRDRDEPRLPRSDDPDGEQDGEGGLTGSEHDDDRDADGDDAPGAVSGS